VAAARDGKRRVFVVRVLWCGAILADRNSSKRLARAQASGLAGDGEESDWQKICLSLWIETAGCNLVCDGVATDLTTGALVIFCLPSACYASRLLLCSRRRLSSFGRMLSLG